METILQPVHDTKNSFYNKAFVIHRDNKVILRSYTTEVCYIEDGKVILKDTYSITTLRHIKEFLKQNGFKAESKAQILNDYKEVV